MRFFDSDKKNIRLLTIIYCVSNLFFLLNYNGMYWDDWALYYCDFESLLSMFSDLSGGIGYVYSLLLFPMFKLGNGVFSFRLATFVLLFFSGIFVYKILENIRFFSNRDRFFIVMFFLLAPLYSAKVALVDFSYTFFSAIFFCSFYLLSKSLDEINIIQRFLVLLLFFLSFTTNSLLVFYAVPLIYIYMVKCYSSQDEIKQSIFLFIKRYFDFILLPIVYFILRSVFFYPRGMYEGYNGISIGALLSTPINFIKSLFTSFVDPIGNALFLPTIYSSAIFFLISVVVFLYIKKNKNYLDFCSKNVMGFLFGLSFFFFAVFPYLAVGKVPDQYDWGSRHQVLMPLGFSFMFYFGIKCIAEWRNVKNKFIHICFFCFAFLFSLYQLNDGIKYNIDFLYQQSIVENLKKYDFLKEENTFIVDVDLSDKLAKNRSFRFYELNGLSRRAFSSADKFWVLDKSQIESYRELKEHTQYNFNSWKESAPFYLSIRENKDVFNDKYLYSIISLIRLKYLDLFDKEEFRKEIKKLVIFSVPLDNINDIRGH